MNHVKSFHKDDYEDSLKKANEIRENMERGVKRPATATDESTPMIKKICGIDIRNFTDTSKAAKYDKDDFKQKRIVKKLANLLCVGNLPTSLVDLEEFKDFAEELNPKASIPSRTTMRKEINKLYEEVKSILDEALTNARKVSLTADIWTQINMLQSYLGITVHYFNPKMKRRSSHKLAMREFPNPHTAARICDLLFAVIEEHGISEKVDYVVPDNGSNMVAGLRKMNELIDEDLEEEEQAEANDYDNDNDDWEDMAPVDENEEDIDVEQRQADEFELHEEEQIKFCQRKKIKRGKCFAHTLQLPVVRVSRSKKTTFGKTLKKTQKFVAKVSKSTKAKYFLKNETTYKKRLRKNVPTRWYSDHLQAQSVNEAMDCEDEPLANLSVHMDWDITITKNDSKILKAYTNIMEPFAEQTDDLGSEKVTTINKVVPTLMELNEHLDEMKNANTGVPGVKQYVTNLKNEMSDYFKYARNPEDKNFDPIYYTACFLDPVRNVVLNKEQTKIAIDHLKERMNIVEGEVVEDIPLAAPVKGKSKFLARRLIKNNNSSNAKKSPFTRDVERFRADCETIQAKLCSDGTDEGFDKSVEDPLDYWVREEKKFETKIAEEAEDILCIPACSTSSERLFSVAGIMSEGRRINTKPDNLEKAVLVKTNRR